MPLYVYVCLQGHEAELVRPLHRRGDAVYCADCKREGRGSKEPMRPTLTAASMKTPKAKIKDPGPGRRPAWF